MPPGKRLGRLLLRGSLWTTGMLGLWWLALQTPSLAVLRFAAVMALSTPGARSIEVLPNGDWNFRVPAVDAPGIDAIEFTIARADVAAFTFSLPLYWALAMAVPVPKAGLRRVGWGAGAVAVVELASLLGFVEITARGIVARMLRETGALGSWPGELGSYLLVQVIPFVAPMAIALASHGELRRWIFPQPGQETPPGQPRGQQKPAERGSR